ncbi:MAG: FtsL-like putative cell division protein [Saprospiraceae bacterium]
MSESQKTKEQGSMGTKGANWILQNLKFVFFLVLLGVLYIANAHIAEKKVREIQSSQKELVQLRWEYLSLKSDMMYDYKMSEVAKAVESKGLRLKQPKRIIVED